MPKMFSIGEGGVCRQDLAFLDNQRADEQGSRLSCQLRALGFQAATYSPLAIAEGRPDAILRCDVHCHVILHSSYIYHSCLSLSLSLCLSLSLLQIIAFPATGQSLPEGSQLLTFPATPGLLSVNASPWKHVLR